MRKLSENAIQEICIAYRSGATISGLARDYGASRPVIRGWLKKRGVTLRPSTGGGGHNRRTVDIEEVCRRYKAGETIVGLAKEFKISTKRVQEALWERSLTRTPTEHFRRYTCDHHFFDVIDTEPKAYWLGFIGADGCVTDKGVLRISLAPKDKAHLDSFKENLGSDHRTYEYSYEERHPTSLAMGFGPVLEHAMVVISSQQLCQGLAQNGIHPRKTSTVEWPAYLSDEMLRHYLRGFFDGDGGWAFNPHVPSHVMFCITSTRPWLEGCQAYLARCLGFRHTKLQDCKYKVPVYKMHYGGGQQIRAFADLMYRDATVWLPRKRQQIEERLSTFGEGHDRFSRSSQLSE